MTAVRFHTTGVPEVLVYEEVPDPVAGEGEVLVRVEAAGVNFSDVMRRRGDDYPDPSPPPFTLGAEIAGTVAALGKGVDSVAVGARVFAVPGVGGYAQYIRVPAAALLPLPPGISAVQATTLIAQGLTASFSLRDAARLAPGESVLIEAAAGGVGSFAVQLARLFGAGKVIAAASTAGKREAARRLGAHETIDYTAPGWAEQVRALTGGRGVDVVLSMAGGEAVGHALDAMAPFGRMIVIGQASGEKAILDPWRLSTLNQSVTGFSIFGFSAYPERVQAALGEILGHVASGKLSLEVGTILPLSQAAVAHRLLEGRKTLGKVVLEPWSDT